jgi:PKD repeat protein
MDEIDNYKPDKEIINQQKVIDKPNKSGRTIKAVAIALYITFLLLSTIPFIADKIIETEMKDSYEYHLEYEKDGLQSHYYVERVDSDKLGRIDLVYTTPTNSLSVSTTNIDILHIFCRSMYEDECQKVYGFDPTDNSNYYKWYFIEKNHLTVNIDSDGEISELSFIDTPIPYEVYVNGLLWYEGKQYNYTDSYGTVLSNVPKGNTHVDIYFKSNDKMRPHAEFVVDRSLVNINTLINFDANKSYDPDGEIECHIWDFGDGNNSGGVKNAHKYSSPGEYLIILTVRDNDFLVDHAYYNLTVVKGSTKPVINGEVPNQIKEEDSPPWELNLKQYGMDFDGLTSDLRWYLTGENSSLYNVIGENNSEQKMIFSLIPNAYGNDLVTLYLEDIDGFNTSQHLWINITSINDKPIIKKLPNLVVHYDVPYKFSFTIYISDVETPTKDLVVSAQDNYNNQYFTLQDQEIVFEYPKGLMNKEI